MNVLISDNHVATRHLITSTLSRKFGFTFVEAGNGLEILEILQRQPIHALIMEAQMPLMGGLETLQVLRKFPQFADLPVIVLTGDKNEGAVQELIKLGVRDVILKPTTAERLVERFERLIGSISVAGRGAGQRDAGSSSYLPEGASAIIADGDADYRGYFKKTARSRMTILEAESGAKALEMCLKAPPDALFLGTNLGLIGCEHIVHRLSQGAGRRIRIIGVPLKSETETARAGGLFDEVIVRTYVPALFDKELTRLLQPVTAFVHFRELIPDIHTRVITAVEQVFGMMLTTDVEQVSSQPFGSEPRAFSSVTLTIPGFVATLRLRMEMSSGQKVGAAFLQSADALADNDVASVLGELANVLAGRLNAGLQERKIEGVMGLPAVGTEPADAVVPAVIADHGLDVRFGATDRPVTFQVVLTVETAAEADKTVVDAASGVSMLRTET